MKKVFHILSHFDVGGAERVAVNIARSRTEGYEYHVVELVRAHSAYTRVFVKELEEAGIRYHRAVLPEVHFHYVVERLAAMTFPLRFLPLFLKHRPAVVHTHTEMPDLAVWWFFTLFPNLLKGCKIIRTIHNTQLWTGLKRTGRRVERLFMRLNANVAISRSVLDCYRKEYGRTAPIIYNGVAETAQRPFNGIVRGKTNILFAGRLEPQKGVAKLIETVKRVKDDGRLHFHVIGDGSLRADVERELGPLECVTIYPPQYDLAAYLASFDYLFMPSEFEGLSIMSIEASLAALPVIANSCPGLRDTLPDDWPLCVRNNDTDQYMSLLNYVTAHNDRRRLGAKAQAFARMNFGIRRMQQAYEALYSY